MADLGQSPNEHAVEKLTKALTQLDRIFLGSLLPGHRARITLAKQQLEQLVSELTPDNPADE